MTINLKEVLSQIDNALEQWEQVKSRSKYDDCSDLDEPDVVRLLNILEDTIDRLAPPGRCYKQNADDAVREYGSNNECNLPVFAGILGAIRSYYESGSPLAIGELVRAEMFSDFLEMAKYLLEEDYKDPAAVLTGGVLEGHLRKLCEKNSIPTEEKGKRIKADRLNANLVSVGVYGKQDQKSIIAWLNLRNDAAHGDYDKYKSKQVELMIQGVTDFASRCPA